MPFFSPVWARRPSVTWVHHVHDTMWEMTLPPRLARARAHHRVPRRAAAVPAHADRHLVGVVEARAGRPARLLGGTGSMSCRRVSIRGSRRAARVRRRRSSSRSVASFRSSGSRSSVDALAACRVRHPQLRAVIVGEGYERQALEARRREMDAESWISLPGWLPDEELVDLYRQAWVVASASAHEGWGMTLTEAAACGTPAVATRIAGHDDAVVHDRTGLLVDGPDFARALDRILADDDVAGPTRRGGACSSRTAHLGRDGARHARGARGRNAPPTQRRERAGNRRQSRSRSPPVPRPGRAPRSVTSVSRCSRTCRCCARRRARSRPTRSSTCTSTPVGCSTAPSSMWDPNIGMGTVTHQNIGYLFPMGPYYWVFDRLGVPDWVAQRLWLGSLLFAAGVGRALPAAHVRAARPGRRRRRARVHADAVLARLRGAHLGAPHAVGGAALADRADAQGVARRRVALSGAVRDRRADRRRRQRDRAGVRRASVRCCGSSYSWLVARDVAVAARARCDRAHRRAHHRRRRCGGSPGCRSRAAYGLNVLRYTETVEAVARTSTPNEILRGLGYWFFYGQDRLGPWIESAANYTQRPVVIIGGLRARRPRAALRRRSCGGGTARSSSASCSSAWSSRSAPIRTGARRRSAPRSRRSPAVRPPGSRCAAPARAVPLVVLATRRAARHRHEHRVRRAAPSRAAGARGRRAWRSSSSCCS